MFLVFWMLLTFRHAASRTGEGNFTFSKLVPYFFALRSLQKKKKNFQNIKLNLKCCSYFTPATFHFPLAPRECTHPTHCQKTPKNIAYYGGIFRTRNFCFVENIISCTRDNKSCSRDDISWAFISKTNSRVLNIPP